MGTTKSNLCAKLGLVCVWVCSHHVGLWFVYGFIIEFGFGFGALFQWLGGFCGSGFLMAEEPRTVWFVIESDGFIATMSLG